MIIIIFIFFLSCQLALTQNFQNRQTYYDGENNHFVQSNTNLTKLSKLKQLLSQIQDPQINSLLKLNLQTLENQKANMLESWYSKQQIDTLIQIKKQLNLWKQCAKTEPYFDGKSCISCKNKGQVFDVVTKKCARCRSGTIYDKKKKLCVSRKSIVNIALTQMDRDTAQQIVLIRVNRIAAGLMDFVHEQTSRLKFRLDNQNKGDYPFVGTPNVTNPHFLNLIIFSNNQKVSDYDIDFEDIPCPPQFPFFSKSQCISCNYPTHLFDSTTNLCVKCSTNYLYSVKKHKCLFNAID